MALNQVPSQIPAANACTDIGSCIGTNNISGVMQGIHDNVNKYVENVHRDALYNQTFNATRYMQNELGSQQSKMDDLVAKSQRQINVAASHAGIAEYGAHRYRYYATVLQFLIFAVASCGLIFAWMVRGTISREAAVIAASVLGACIAASFYVATRVNLSRRNDAWDKFYWDSARNGAKGPACSA
jgi:NADH:ubiquinone oxidoreductase subunit 3 (subunit A)